MSILGWRKKKHPQGENMVPKLHLQGENMVPKLHIHPQGENMDSNYR